MKRFQPKVRQRERGVVIIWTAFFLVFMLGFVALGIDVAKLMATRTQLQNAADAAALAGASALDPSTGLIVPDVAIARARYTASRNKAFVNDPQPVNLMVADIAFPANNECRVTVRRSPSAGGSMVTHVAQVLGIKGLEVRATATAKAEPTGTVDCGLAPLYVHLTSGPLETGCSPGYILKRGGGAGSTGNYGALDYSSCGSGLCAGLGTTGADAYRCLLENGFCCSVSEGQVLATEPGNMSGPTKVAIDARFSSDTDDREGICYSQYQGNGRRVLYIPITTAPEQGRTTVQVLGFGAFFLKNRPDPGNQSTLVGEFLYATIPGSGGDADGDGTLFTLRLIE